MSSLLRARFAAIACAFWIVSSVYMTSPVAAGIITGISSISGPGLGFVAVPAIVTPNPNNDNQIGGGPEDNNIVVPLKRFDRLGHIDMEFVVDNSQGVTEYRVFEFVDNNTGSDWIRYEMVLGYGVGAAFVPSLPGDGLDFDFPTFDTPPTSGAFSTVVLGENMLSFTGGTHGSGAQPYEFRIDVPDLPVDPLTGRVTFTLRQIPVVPEPSGVALAGLALAALALWKRRR